MSFRLASPVTIGSSQVITHTMPAGVIASDHSLLVIGNSGGSGAITLSGPAGMQYATIVGVRNENNMGIGAWEVWGLVAGDVITFTTTTTLNKIIQSFTFTNDLGPIGSLATRNAVSQTTTLIPGRSIDVGAKMLVFSQERTLAAGGIASVVSATGETVTQLSFFEQAGLTDCSFYLGEFTAAANPTGQVTVTYATTSGNSYGFQMVELEGTQSIPSIAPSFGNQNGQFTASLVVPSSPGTFKSAGALVAATGQVSLPVPAGTVPGDVVYILTAWGTSTIRNVVAQAPAARLPTSTVVATVSSGNLAWNIQAMTGLTAGDIIVMDGGSGSLIGKLFVFNSALGAAGGVGLRVGAIASTDIPGTAVVTATPVYLFSIERTLAAGTVVTNAVNVNGSTVSQLAFEEQVGGDDISVYLGMITPASGASGTTTITYNHSAASPNGLGVTVPSVSAPAAIAPIFGTPSKGFFAARITPADGLVRVDLGRPAHDTVRVKSYTQNVAYVRLGISVNANMAGATFSGQVVPDVDGYAQMEVGGLQPDTPYYWQVECAGIFKGTINTVRTWPIPGQIAPVTAILAGSCQKGFGTFNGASNPGTYALMAARKDAADNAARLYVNLGDEFYPCATGSPNGTVFPPSPIAVRNWYEAQHGLSGRIVFHRNIPTSHTYSDNDFIGSNSDSTINPVAAAVSNAVRRQVLCDGPFGSTDGKGLYWSGLLGRTLIIQTDSRTYSSNTMLPNNTPGKSMLGAAQKQWLKDQLVRKDCSAIIWCHDNQWVGPPAVSTGRPALDNWQAFSVERQEITDHILANDVPLLLYVQGDNHALLYDDGTNNSYGHFPFTIVAPVYNDANAQGLTATGGKWPTVNTSNMMLYSWIEITDTGDSISARVDSIDGGSGASVVKFSNTATITAERPVHWLMHEFYQNIDVADVLGSTGGDGGGAGAAAAAESARQAALSATAAANSATAAQATVDGFEAELPLPDGAARIDRWATTAFDPPPSVDIPVVSINAGTGVIPTPVTYTPLRQTPGNNATNVDTVNDPTFAYSGVGANGLIPATANNIYVNGDTKPGGTAQAARMLPMFEWVTFADQMELRVRTPVTNQSLGHLIVNGRWVQEQVIPLVVTAGNSYYVKLTFPSAGVRRHIQWIPSTSMGLASLNLPAGYSAFKPVGKRKRTIAIVGDSFVNGSGSAPTGAATGETFALRLAHLMGADGIILAGIGGTKWVSDGTVDATGFGSDFGARMPWVLGQKPDVVIFNGSVNDSAGNPTSVAALTAAVKAAVDQAKDVPEVYVCGTWRTGQTLLNIDNAVKDGAAQAGRPFIDLWGFIYGSGHLTAVTGDGNADWYVATDNIHPTWEAHRQVARYLYRGIAGFWSAT